MQKKRLKSFNVLTTDEFLKDAKSIVKVYPGFRKDLQNLIASLESNPATGNHLGNGIYKLRISISGKPAGKSFGARVIYWIFTFRNTVFLLRVYDKSNKGDLTKDEMKNLVEAVRLLKEKF